MEGLDLRTGKHVRRLPEKEGDSIAVKSVAWSPDGTRLVSAGGEKKPVIVWDLLSGVPLLTLKARGEYVNSVAFSPDGTRIVSGGGSLGDRDPEYPYFAEIRVWDASTGDLKFDLQLKGHRTIDIVRFNPEGTRILSLSKDGRLTLRDAQEGKELFTVVFDLESSNSEWAHESLRLAFSGDGKRIRLFNWRLGQRIDLDAATGKRLPLDDRLLSSTRRESVHPDGKSIAQALYDNIVVYSPPRASTPADQYVRQRAGLRWHAVQAAAAEKAKLWTAAAFHLERLHRADPSARQRLLAALKQADDSPLTQSIKRGLAATDAARAAGSFFLPPLARPALMPGR